MDTTKYFCGDEFILSGHMYPDMIVILAQVAPNEYKLINSLNGNRSSDNIMIPKYSDSGLPYITHEQLLEYLKDHSDLTIELHQTADDKLIKWYSEQ